MPEVKGVKPKKGTAWAVVGKRDRRIDAGSVCENRRDAVRTKRDWDCQWPEFGPHRVVRVRIEEITPLPPAQRDAEAANHGE